MIAKRSLAKAFVRTYKVALSIALLCAIMFVLGALIGPYISPQIPSARARSPFSQDAALNEAQDRIAEQQIRVFSDRILLDIANVKFAPVANTSSMLPFLHSGAHTLEVQPKDEMDLKVGDIISFYVEEKDMHIIHVISEIGNDDQGWYAKTKGYNNPVQDPWLVRFSQIEGVLVGVVY